jgi:HEAT repeat protein
MRGWRTGGLILALVVALVGGTPGLAFQKDDKGKDKAKDPIVRGKPLSAWIESLKGKDLLPRIEAIRALEAGGGPETLPAAPALIGIFRDSSATFIHPLAAVALARIGPEVIPQLTAALEDKALLVRSGSVLALTLLGPRAAPAVKPLAAILRRDPESMVRGMAASALSQIGSHEALPVLREALADRDAGVRVEVAEALWKINKEVKDSLPVLVAVVELGVKDDSQSGPAAQAARLLGEMGPSARSAAPALRSALASRSGGLRISSAQSLWKVSGDTEQPLAVLKNAVGSKERPLRHSTASALGLPISPECVPPLLKLMSDADENVRREAACSLAAWSEKGELDRKVLAEALRDRDAGVCWWASLAWLGSRLPIKGMEEELLGGLRQPWLPAPGERQPRGRSILEVMAQADRRALPVLARILESRPGMFRIEAARAHGLFASSAPEAQTVLLQALRQDDKLVRRAAAEALGQFGPAGLPGLLKALNNEDARVREGAARAVGFVGPAAGAALPRLRTLLKEEESTGRVQSALALWEIERKPETPLIVLRMGLVDVDLPDRWEVMEALVQIAVEARPPIRGMTEVLLNGVKDRDARVRVVAVRGLWKREGQPKNIVPLLRDSVSDRDAFVRQMALETLAEMPPDAAIVGLLSQSFEDRDPSVRQVGFAGLVRGGEAGVEFLIPGLESEHPRIRAGTARVLGAIGPAAKAALPALRKRVKDPDDSVRSAVQRALREITPP